MGRCLSTPLDECMENVTHEWMTWESHDIEYLLADYGNDELLAAVTRSLLGLDLVLQTFLTKQRGHFIHEIV